MSNAKLEVLTPQNSQLIFIDQQPQMAFGVQSIDRQTLKNNVVGLAKASKIFSSAPASCMTCLKFGIFFTATSWSCHG